MNCVYYLDPVDRCHQENLQFLKAQQYRNNKVPFGRWIELAVARRMAELGYQVSLTSPLASYDLEVYDERGRQIRIEVKGALAYRHPRRSVRYQANIRNQDFQILIFVCFDGDSFYYFVIPRAAVAGRRNVTIWNQNPARYGGRWAKFYEAWDILEQAIRSSRPQARQLAFG